MSSTENNANQPFLETMIGYEFDDKNWMDRALTAKSYINENKEITYHNQPLATLGDAVIRVLVMETLYNKGYDEKGDLTKEAETFVKREYLTDIGRGLGLEHYILWGKGDRSKKIWNEGTVLGEFLESLFGAIFLDGGMVSARDVFNCIDIMNIPDKNFNDSTMNNVNN